MADNLPELDWDPLGDAIDRVLDEVFDAGCEIEADLPPGEDANPAFALLESHGCLRDMEPSSERATEARRCLEALMNLPDREPYARNRWAECLSAAIPEKDFDDAPTPAPRK